MAKATSNAEKATPTAKKGTESVKKETKKKSAKVSADVTEQAELEENVIGTDADTSTAVKEKKTSTRGRKKKEASEPEASEPVVEEKPKKRTRISKPAAEQVVVTEAVSDTDDAEDDFDETEEEKPRTRRARRQRTDDIADISSPHAITLEKLDKSNVWTLDEQELFDIYVEGRKHDSFSENEVHYMNLIRPVFELEFFDFNNKEKKKEYEEQGFYIFPTPSTNTANAMAIRRRPIKKIMDLTLENVFYIDPKAVLKLIDENMGTGWQGLPLAIQDIISAAFYVDCSVMPEFALHRPGGIIEKRLESGYEVLEIPRGSWIEAVFIKVKPKQEKLHFEAISDKPVKKKREKFDDDEDFDEEDEDIEDENLDDEDDGFEDENEEPDENNIELEDIDMVDPSSDDE